MSFRGQASGRGTQSQVEDNSCGPLDKKGEEVFGGLTQEELGTRLGLPAFSVPFCIQGTPDTQEVLKA